MVHLCSGFPNVRTMSSPKLIQNPPKRIFFFTATVHCKSSPKRNPWLCHFSIFAFSFMENASKQLQSNSGDHQNPAHHPQFCTSKLLKYISIWSTTFLHQVLQDHHLSLFKVKSRVIFCGGMRTTTTQFIIWQTSAFMPKGFQSLLLISAQSLWVEHWSIYTQSRVTRHKSTTEEHWKPKTMNKMSNLRTQNKCFKLTLIIKQATYWHLKPHFAKHLFATIM